MSKQEFSRLDVLLRVQSGRLRISDACVLIGLQRRQVFRLLRGLEQNGATSLLSKRRGQPSNHRLPAEVRTLALSIVRERYWDFGPSLAAEKLAEHHGCPVARETLRGWMIADGLWQDRRHRLPSPHQPRRRRDCLGELVQIDGSEHAWFEDRGPLCTLLAFVDDATSRLMQLRFVISESAFDYFRTSRAYLEAQGKPVAFYSDKHGIFRVNRKGAVGGEGVTQFGRALLALNIDIICANSPQAKGRIERAFGTLQDRMVKELRLAGVSSMAAANAWLPGFITAYNTRFGRDPANAKDLHRPLAQADDLDEILAWREERTVTRNLTLHYDRMMLLLDPTPAFAGAGLYGAFDVKRFFPPLSVAAVAAWRIDRLQLLEIELSDGLKLVSQSRSFEVIRQVVEPSAVFVLQIDQRRAGGAGAVWFSRRSLARCRAWRSAGVIATVPMRSLGMLAFHCQS